MLNKIIHYGSVFRDTCVNWVFLKLISLHDLYPQVDKSKLKDKKSPLQNFTALPHNVIICYYKSTMPQNKYLVLQ